jgi:hypothetical protein
VRKLGGDGWVGLTGWLGQKKNGFGIWILNIFWIILIGNWFEFWVDLIHLGWRKFGKHFWMIFRKENSLWITFWRQLKYFWLENFHKSNKWIILIEILNINKDFDFMNSFKYKF